MSIMINNQKTIIITGASSGLGFALALEYSKHHNIHLFLFGRNQEKLEEIALLCKKNGSKVSTLTTDVTNQEEMTKHIHNIAIDYGVDIVIACAGVSAGTLDGLETTLQVRKIMDVNVAGVLNTILPAIEKMIQRRQGKVVIISSMASIIGLSSAPSYSASKGAIRIFGEALSGYLRKYNISVSVVIPGYIHTPMTQKNQFPMPFLMSPTKAAMKIIKGIEKEKKIIAFPVVIYFALKIVDFIVPSYVLSYINSKLPGKPAFDKDVH